MLPLAIGAGMIAGQLFNAHQTNRANVAMTDSTNQLSREEAQTNRQFQTEQVGAARQWEENMSNTAHQREMKDLLAAGINPIHAAGGSGASTPSSPAPSGGQASFQAPQISMPDLMAMGMSLAQLDQRNKELGIQEKAVNSQAAKNLTDQEYTKVQTETSKRGMTRAHIDEKIDKVLNKGIDWLLDSSRKPKFKKSFENTIQETPSHRMP